MNMNKGSMIELAIKILEEKKAMSFKDLWEQIKTELEITPEEEADRIGRFYTDLSLSGETILLADNNWDLRKRHTFEELTFNKDVSDIYSDLSESDNDETDVQENKEYDESVNGTSTSEEDEDSISDEESEDEEKDRHARQEAAELIGEVDR